MSNNSMMRVIKLLTITCIILNFLFGSGCLNINSNNEEIKIGKEGDIIIHLLLSDSILYINKTSIEFNIIIQNIRDYTVIVDKNDLIEIENINNSKFHFIESTPTIMDIDRLYRPGNTSEIRLIIDTQFFLLYNQNLTYKDIEGTYRIKYQIGIYSSKEEYFLCSQ